jgi:signal transduction histidine kinase
MNPAQEPTVKAREHRLRAPARAWAALRRSLRWRLVLVFLLLAFGLAAIFLSGMQKALAVGWRDAARPLLMDYVDRLAAEVAEGGTPQVARAQALVQRLPIQLSIAGPQVNWSSHPERTDAEALRGNHRAWGRGEVPTWGSAFQRRTADGHTLRFGLDAEALAHRPALLGSTLTALLFLTLLAYLYVRRLLRPLDAIQAGAQRFGAGDFSQTIAVRHPKRPDELGQLAATINTMGRDIAQMLDAKRALLLAISHELRSPLTRARVHTELLPETPEVNPQRAALLRDLQEMVGLINDLLESERLASRHAALQREPVALEALARSVIEELQLRHGEAAARVVVQASPGLPMLALDPARLRLLLRNLLDNALRHGGAQERPPELHLRWAAPGAAAQGAKEQGNAAHSALAQVAATPSDLEIEVRDHGAGVPEAQLPHLAEPFFRPDSARTRDEGGAGLGLYLCRLVAQAHGGSFAVRNAQPGLRVVVRLPL